MKRLTFVFVATAFLLFLSGCAETNTTNNLYNISFDSNGGILVDSIEVSEGETTILPMPVREGYTFTGWFTGEGPSGTQFTNSNVVTQNLDLIARWDINQYTLSFDTDGDSEIDSITQDYDSVITQPSNPVKEGYTFIGWSEEVPDNMPAEDMTLTAQWEINQYSLTYKDYDGSILLSLDFSYNATLENINIPSPLRSGYRFIKWSIELPNNMPSTDIEISPYYVINGLDYQIDNNIAEVIGYSGNLEFIVIPDSIEGYPVKSIGDLAFFQNQLKIVVLPSSVNSVGNYAFYGNQITDLFIPDSVNTIGGFAFASNDISNIFLPESLLYIETNAFAFNNIQNLVIPNSVISIGDQAFDWHELTSLVIQNNVKYKAQNNLLMTNDNKHLLGGIGKLNSLVVPNTVETIADSAFRDNELTNITIPNTVQELGNFSFMQNKLTRIIIPESITSIGTSTFFNNDISFLVIPKSVQDIGNNAFASNSLTSITIPDSVAVIGDRAFQCNQLTRITIPESVIQIGEDAFSCNYQLSSVTILGDSTRFNDVWEEIGFPSDLKPE